MATHAFFTKNSEHLWLCFVLSEILVHTSGETPEAALLQFRALAVQPAAYCVSVSKYWRQIDKITVLAPLVTISRIFVSFLIFSGKPHNMLLIVFIVQDAKLQCSVVSNI